MDFIKKLDQRLFMNYMALFTKTSALDVEDYLDLIM